MRTMEVRDPQNNSVIDVVQLATVDQLYQVIESAKAGSGIAAAMPTHERIDILYRAVDWIRQHSEDYAYIIAREGSKTIREARKEVQRCIQTLNLSAEEARRIHGETINFDQMPGSENRMGYYYRFPIGVIAAITPFNDPLNLVAHKVGPAIASGNAIIVKPSSDTPLSALLLEEAFAKAGLPEGVLKVITGKASEIGFALVSHPDVNMISFTGGLETGRSIARDAGIKKLSMELGSNSPVIVLKDANLEEAVKASVSGAFGVAGQNCLGVQRVYVEEGVFSEFTQRFVKQTLELNMGDKLSEQTDMGPMINEREAKRVEEWVNEAVEQGASLLCGGERDGAFYTPTVITDLPEGCTLAKEEVFGPVVILYSVPDLYAAVRESNRVNYGLQAGIFTRDLEAAFYAVGQIQAGGVMINDSSDYRIDAMPFGGVKGSGLGREGVKFAIQEMTEPKVVCFKVGGF
jgi:glyceraldehyde-3-phosphate dehydrogenase (NADP+)